MKQKNLRKNFIGTAVIFSICASMLAGCGNNSGGATPGGTSQPQSNGGNASVSTAPETPADQGTVYKYRMAMFNNGPWHEPTPSLAYYGDLFPDMEIELVYVEKANADEKINLLISSGDTPDVMQMVNKDTLYAQGVLGSWSEDFLREHAPNVSRIIDETDPDSWGYTKYDGENMYTIPGWNLNRTIPEVSVWNKDWLDAVGETVPSKLADAERIFYKFANEDPDGNGVNDTYGLSEKGFKPIYGAYGMMREMWLDDGQGNLVYGDVMPGAKEALTTLNKWYSDGVIDPEFITGENEGGYWALSQPLNKNKIGYTNAGWWYHWNPVLTDLETDLGGRNYQEFMAVNPTGTLEYGVPLEGPDGHTGHRYDGQSLVLRTHFSKELCSDTSRFARLLQFIDYANASDYNGDIMPVIRNTFGEQGTEWEYRKTADGREIVSSLITDPDEMSFRGYTGTFHFMEEGGSLEYQQLKADEKFDWVKDVISEYPDCYMNKLYITLETAGEYKSELDKLLNEGYIAIITGEKPIDYFDEMVKLWYDNGGKEMTEEANAWYSQL